jgi:hypothetical protein
MEVTITIPDDVAERVIDGLCYNCGYQDNLVFEEGKSTKNPRV